MHETLGWVGLGRSCQLFLETDESAEFRFYNRKTNKVKVR